MFPSLRQTLLVAALIVAIASIIPLGSERFFDDAYIHARIVRNLMAIGRPVFDPTDTVTYKASSSTGYTLLLTALTTLVGDVIGAIVVLQRAALAASLVALALIGRRLRLALACLVVAVALPPVFIAARGGMDTAVASACTLLGGAALLHRRHTLALTLIAAAAGLRIEYLVLFALLVAHLIWVERMRWGVLLAAIPALLCYGFDLHTYGTIIPHAAIAKAHVYDLSLRDALRQLVGTEGMVFAVLTYGAIGLAAVIALAEGGGATDQVGRRSPVLPFIWMSAALLLAWIIGRSLIFPWYPTLLATTTALALAVGATAQRRRRSSAPPALAWRTTLVAAVGLAAIGLRTIVADRQDERRVPHYLAVGRALAAACPSCTLLTSEIGGLGWAFPGRVLDAAGIADPSALSWHPMPVPAARGHPGIGAIPVAYVTTRDPDFLVSMPIFTQAVRRERILASYHRYVCLFEPEVLIFSNTMIELYARTSLSSETLAQAGCHRG